MQKKSRDIVSFSMNEEMQEALTKRAKEKSVSRSELVRNLVTKFIVDNKKATVVEHDADHIPVVLKIPVSLRGNPEGLRLWLDARVKALVTKLGS